MATSAYFDRASYPFEEISSATFSLSNPMQVLKKGIKIVKGLRQSLFILRRFAPDVVVGFGSFYTLPVLLAALKHKVPIILHEQNSIPGKVNRLFSKFSHTTTITFPESAKYLKGTPIEVAFPIRKKTFQEGMSAWDYFGLTPNQRTLLVFGGSQGAAKLNTLFLAAAEKLTLPFQVLHFTGKQTDVEKTKAHYRKLGIRHCVKAFEPFLEEAMQIADMAIARSGASTIAELIESATPAILIPFPFATENHQVKNGDHFVKKVGGGWMYLEHTLDAETLAAIITQGFEKEAQIKKISIQRYKKERKVKELSQLILSL